jgi:hypothetical protein
MVEHTSAEALRRILEGSESVAVLGAHPESSRPASYVPAYLDSVGYRVYPVNPRKVGMRLWGKPVRATLAELSEAVDVVNVFRRSDALGEHLADILAMRPLPKVVWLQLGIRNDGFAEQLLAAGIDVVQDRCTLAEHRRLGIAHRGVS